MKYFLKTQRLETGKATETLPGGCGGEGGGSSHPLGNFTKEKTYICNVSSNILSNNDQPSIGHFIRVNPSGELHRIAEPSPVERSEPRNGVGKRNRYQFSTGIC